VETPTYYKATFWADHVSCPVILHQLCFGVIGALHLGKRVSTEKDKIPKVRKNLHEQLFVCGLKCSKQYRKMPKHSSKAGAYKKEKVIF